MSQSVNTNIISLNSQRNLSTSQTSLATSMQRLSSGLRVNSAKDDAAGLAIAERMNAQVKGMNVAVRNANDAISLSQTAEGALGKIGDNLQRMRELAVQSRNATNSAGDRANLQKEFKQLQEEIQRTVDGTKFNGTALFASGAASTLSFQVGAGTSEQDRIDIAGAVLGGGSAMGAAAAVSAMSGGDSTDEANLMATVFGGWDGTNGIAIGGGASAGTAVAGTSQIDDAINAIDKALDLINDKRASFGASQNRFDAVISNLQTNIENQSAARGRIMDADFASETANLSRAQILQQAGTAMVAQANSLPQQVLSLLN
ncbi:MAG: flagellin FliC [Burkholderiales bacterium]|nr:flagellin FliC [Burkholderiales bacterium]